MRRRKINDRLLLELLKEGKTQRQIAKIFGTSESAVSQRATKLIPPEGVVKALEGLSDKEKGFCLAVAGGKSFTESALQNYECSSRESAKQIGLRNKKNPKLAKAIEELKENKSKLFEKIGLGRPERFKRWKDFVFHPDPMIGLTGLKEVSKITEDYTPQDTSPDADLNITPEEIESLQELAKGAARKAIEASRAVIGQGDNGNNEDTNNDT